MAIFLRDPTYHENENSSGEFETKLMARLSEEFPESVVFDADAGPSASIPGWMMPLTAAGWFIFTAPTAIEDNLPLWENAFNKISEIAAEFDAQLSIDVHDATARAFQEVLRRFDWATGKIEIIDLICHWRNLNGVYSHHFDLDEITEPDGAMVLHEQAIRQYDCRYILLLRNAEWNAVTVLVNSNGTVELCTEL